MTQEVNFEIAKLLEERGFSEKTLQAYVYRGVEHQDSSYKGILTKDKLLCDISAPTIADVITWLYEKHGIWIDVSLNQFSKPKDLQWMYSIVFTEDCTYSHSPKSYTSPTEAYEAAIEYVLENSIQEDKS